MISVKRKPAILIDLSGTLHIDDRPIPGAAAALNKLRASGFPVRFVTNTTKVSKMTLVKQLRDLSFDSIDESEIFTSLSAAREYLISNSLFPGKLFLTQDALTEFSDMIDKTKKENANAVVVGLAPDMFDYENLTDAMRILLNGGQLVAIHAARYYATKDGLCIGPGAFVKGLEYSAGVKAVTCGKPTASFFELALRDIGASPADAIMIGDDVRDDICGSQSLGMRAILVKTGKYREGDEFARERDGQNNEQMKPWKCVQDFAEAVDILIEEFIE